MKKWLFVAAASLALAACEGKEHKALVKACVTDGYDQKTCACLAKEARKSMDKDVYQAVALQAEGKEAEAAAIMEKLPIEKQFTAGSGIVSAMGACSVDATAPAAAKP